MYTELDSLTCPLEGSAIIEAAAGTGKTYNIQNLYVRLVLEEGLAIEQILVVTFTNAATAELRKRVRDILVQIQRHLQGEVSSDSRIDKLLNTPNMRNVEEQEKLRRINSALRTFDLAQIFTIDGFCQRLYGDFAVENGVRYKPTVIANNKELLDEICKDLFLKLKYSTTKKEEDKDNLERMQPRIAALGITEDKVKALLHLWLEHPNAKLKCNGEYLANDTSVTATKAYNTKNSALQKLQSILDQLPAKEIKARLKCGEVFKDMLAKKINASDPKLLPALSLWSAPNYQEQFRKTLCDKSGCSDETATEFLRAATEFIQSVTLFLPATLREILQQRKQEEGCVTYADVLHTVSLALANNDELRQKVRQRYKAAIIDEFQDTNKDQYQIFQRLFTGDKQVLFMVGDPRQAIYAFRGGDINTYMTARENSQKHYTLSTNYRSTAAIVKKVEELFKNFGFARENMDLPQLSAGGTVGKCNLRYCGQPCTTPIFDKEVDENGYALFACNVTKMLLSGNWELELPGNDGNVITRPVQYSDIAILVCKNYQAKDIHQTLTRCGIPASLTKEQSLFQIQEAQDLLDVMEAMASPDDQTNIAKALITPLCGYSIPKLAKMKANPQEIAQHQKHFARATQLWQEENFTRAYRWILKKYKSFSHIAQQDGSERRLSIYTQLADFLQNQINAQHLDLPGTIAYLKYQIRHKDDQDDMDSSADKQVQSAEESQAVNIMTIHKSKGLQYKIVIIPTYDESGTFKDVYQKGSKQLGSFQDQQKNEAIDIGATPAGSSIFAYSREQFQEQLRKLYVALTRAEYAVFLATPPDPAPNETPKISPLQWLLLNGLIKNSKQELLADSCAENGDFAQIIGSYTSAHCSEANLATLPDDSDACNGNASDATSALAIAPPAEEVIQTIQNSFKDVWRISSYSSIAGGSHGTPAATPSPATTFAGEQQIHTDEEPEDSPTTSPNTGDTTTTNPQEAAGSDSSENTPTPTADIPQFAFPGGAFIGDEIHAFLENLDFTNITPEELEPRLKIHFGERFSPQSKEFQGLLELFKEVLQCRFSLHDGTPFTLGEIPATQRRPELDFHFKLNHDFPWKAFHELLGDTNGTATPMNANSLFTGIIDLLFLHEEKLYILDWKSNMLGKNLDNFLPQNLPNAIIQADYHIQYLIYTAAVMKYLQALMGKTQVDEELYQHFGGIYYVFLRGLKKDTDRGLFFTRPDLNTIQKLMDIFG